MQLKPGWARETALEAMGGVLVVIFTAIAVIGSDWIGAWINYGVATAAHAIGLI